MVGTEEAVANLGQAVEDQQDLLEEVGVQVGKVVLLEDWWGV